MSELVKRYITLQLDEPGVASEKERWDWNALGYKHVVLATDYDALLQRHQRLREAVKVLATKHYRHEDDPEFWSDLDYIKALADEGEVG